MKQNLVSTLWPETVSAMRACHLSVLNNSTNDIKWREAFALLVQSIEEERAADENFALELSELDDDTASSYSFADILEEYFDFLEENQDWIAVISSCNQMLHLFSWSKKYPSEYMFRKGNALQKSGRLGEAEKFGREWLEKYPSDPYAAASNVFLLISLNKLEEAKELTEKYLGDNLICEDAYDTFYMAAYRLYELTDDINAKQRVEKKIAEYNALRK